MGAVKTLCYPIWFQSPEKCYPIWVHITTWADFGNSTKYVPLFCKKQGYKVLNTVKKRPNGLSNPSNLPGFFLTEGNKILKTAGKRPITAHKLVCCCRQVIADSHKPSGRGTQAYRQ